MPIILGQISQKRKGTPAGAETKPATQVCPPTFLTRSRLQCCRKPMAGQRLRRARELLAQIVLFGVELGVGIVGALVGGLVGKFAHAEAGTRARRPARIVECAAWVVIMSGFSQRGEESGRKGGMG
jgi:hypothetical protein